jgi:tetratricopeptide (TPR) repeat protein
LLVEEVEGGVRVSLRRAGQVGDEAGAAVAFVSPFTAAAREDLRWYLESYLGAPYAVYEARGQAIQERLRGWGEALFEGVFGAGKPGHDLYLQAREGQAELALTSRSPGFLGLPWELLKDPERDTPLALAMTAFDRTISAAGAATPVPPGDTLRVLMVIARPAGLQDVGYQMVARPLLQRLDAVRGKVVLEVLRPPTLERLVGVLRAAVEAGRPYHILHFDGYGPFGAVPAGAGGAAHFDAAEARGFLLFEQAGGGARQVAADQFALVVGEGKVPLVVLHACRSGMVGEEAAVATRLLEGGAASVVAMGYSVYAVAAAEFMAEFYEALFAGRTVSAAVAAGRQRLHRNPQRPSPKGPLPLADWIVPVHYLRRAIDFPQLRRPRGVGLLSLDTLLRQADGDGTEAGGTGVLTPERRFIGRDVVFYTLEQALPQQRMVVVHGPAGIGKTELAKAFGRWWQATGGVEQPEWVLFYAFEPGLASFGLDGVLSEIGLRLYGPEFAVRTRDAAQREAVLLKVLREHRMLLLWDNFESVHSLPDPHRATPPLDAAERARMRGFLMALRAEGGRSAVLITSRSAEEWLGEVRRVGLGGLTPSEAVEMADDVLQPYPAGQQRRQERAFAELLEWLGGHPLSLRLLLPHLEQVSASALLAGLNSNTAGLPPGFVGEGRTRSLGASLAYSFDQLAAEDRERTWALGLFEAVVDEDVLGLFSAAAAVPARFAGTDKEVWAGLLRRLAAVGLLNRLDAGMYRLHPALPAWLTAAWRVNAGAGFAAERATADDALLAAYAAMGEWLFQQIQGGAEELAFGLLDRQRATMGRLLGQALAVGRYAEAAALMRPLNEFWNVRGLGVEADGWVDRCRASLEQADGSPPALESAAGALWLFAVSARANRAQRAGDLDAAAATHDAIRISLEASKDEAAKSRLAVVYHQLGMVAQHRGDLAAAEEWYQKSLAITEVLGERPGLATTYHQLGRVAQHRGDLVAAEQWYRRSLAIGEALGDRPGLAMSYHQLGIVAQHRGDLAAAEEWYRKSLAILEALGDRLGLASSYHHLGIVAQDRGDLAAAEQWYLEALAIVEALGDRPRLASSYHELGKVAQYRGELAAAEQWYRKSLAILEALGDRPGLAGSFHQLGIVAQLRGDLAAAEQWYQESLTIKEALGDRPGLARSYQQLGVVAQDRGDLAAAEQWYQKSLQIKEALGDRPGLAITYGQLGLLAERRGQVAAALDWTVRCVALFAEFPHPATGPGPRHLVRLTGTLGLPALEASWQRCTGAALPPAISQAVAASPKNSS